MNNNEYNKGFGRSDWKSLLHRNNEKGHKLFLHKQTRMIAIADYSGLYPHETDDGVLWVDYSKSIEEIKGRDSFKIPLIEIEDDGSIRECVTISDERTATKIQEVTGQKINYV